MAREKTQAAQALGRAIRAARVERGYSQEGFAAHAGFDRSYFGAIERGEFNVSLSTVVKLTHALDTSLCELARRAGL
jgi:transcriptional regulator with XRE-family HTH domain